MAAALPLTPASLCSTVSVHVCLCEKLGTPSCCLLLCVQTGQMRLTPNNPNSVATVVQYGFTADNLNMTVTGFAEVCGSPI